MIFTSKQIKTQILLVLVLLLVVTINSSCISLTKSLKEKSPLIIEMDTDKHLGKFTEYGISKNMVSTVNSYLDIVSQFMLSITNRSFYCSFNYQLDWIKFYYYTQICCKMNSGGKKLDKQLLMKLLSLSLTKRNHIYVPQLPANCQRYVIHTSLGNKIKTPLTIKWQQSSFQSFNTKIIESTICPLGDDKSQCSTFLLFPEELLICTKVIRNHMEFVGHHTHFKIHNFKIPQVYVFENVNNSYDELIFFLQNSSFQSYDDFSKILANEVTSKKREDTMYFCLTNCEGDRCIIGIEFTKPLSEQCQIIGILSKKNSKHEYKLKNLFYLPSISFVKN